MAEVLVNSLRYDKGREKLEWFEEWIHVFKECIQLWKLEKVRKQILTQESPEGTHLDFSLLREIFRLLTFGIIR
jgi:hypothetical protein